MSVRTRRVEGYYNSLLAREVNIKENNVHVPVPLNDSISQPKVPNGVGSEKWKGQIEKVGRCVDIEREKKNI